MASKVDDFTSTTVEIILYYLTLFYGHEAARSTTVEIILYYLTSACSTIKLISTTVEIILYYLTTEIIMPQKNLQQ